MLFSDVEQSTLLLTRLGRAYEQALDGSRTAQRAAWARFDGVEMGTEGDSFFVVFSAAEAAVAAAVEAQRALVGRDWPEGGRFGFGWVSTLAVRGSSTTVMLASMCTVPLGSPRPRTAAR